MSLYRVIESDMMYQDSSLEEYENQAEGRIGLRTIETCGDLQKNLKPIEFMIQNTTFTITPRGYLYSMDGHCYVGIEGIPNSLNQYRLGNVFLRSFYTVLDFDNDIIMLGLNVDGAASKSAYINHMNAHKIVNSPAQTVFIVILILVLLCIAAVIGYKVWQKRKQASTPFAKTTHVRKDEEETPEVGLLSADKPHEKDSEEEEKSESSLSDE